MNVHHQPTQSRYVVRIGRDHDLLQAGLRLRAAQYRGSDRPNTDQDRHDAGSHHIVVRTCASDHALAYARLRRHESHASVLQGYSGRRYDLSGYCRHIGPAAELGRICLAPAAGDPNVLRSLWGAIARCVVQWRVGHVFGCHSFDGVDPCGHQRIFYQLTNGHLAPETWQVAPRAADSFSMVHHATRSAPAPAGSQAMTQSYRAMGAVFAPQGTIDHELQRLHVFASLDVKAVSPARRQAMVRLAREIVRERGQSD